LGTFCKLSGGAGSDINLPGSEDAPAANSSAAVHAASEAPDGEAANGGSAAGEAAGPARTGWEAAARDWSGKMFGGAQSSAGHVGTAVATVIGGALGTLLVRHSAFVLAGVAAYGLIALGLYCAGPVSRRLRGLRPGPGRAPGPAAGQAPAEAAGDETAAPAPSGAAPGEAAPGGAAAIAPPEPEPEPAQAPPPPQGPPAWLVRGGTVLLVGLLAASCFVLGYWGIGNGLAHGAGWAALSLAATFALAVLVARWWQRARPFRLWYPRHRTATTAMACCAAAAALSAGTTLGRVNLIPPCPAPAELTVLTSQEDLAAVQAALPGFERTEPARLHTACYAVDVTAYAAPTDLDAWRGLRTGWGSRALGTVGPRPDVWIPGSTAEVAPVRQERGPRLTSLGSIASSPLVAAVPASLVSGPLARLPRVGSPWRTIYGTLSGEQAGLAIPDPAVSETARLGIAGLYPGLTPAQQHGIEASGSFPAGSGNLLCDAAQAAEHADGQPAAAYLVSEAALYASNADQLTGGTCAALTQRPAQLTAFYPDGAVALNFPFVTVDWGGRTGAGRDSALSGYRTDLFGWLTGQGQPALTGLGLRPPGCARLSPPPAGITGAVPACGVASLPTAAAVASARASFAAAQAPAHIVIGIDDSGPMEPYLPQITAAVDAELGPGATYLGGRDSFGIWKLPGDRKGQIDQQLVRFGPAGESKPRVRAGVGFLSGHGHSANYSMLKRAGRLLYAQQAPGPPPSNSVILLTDGDGYPAGDPDGSSEVSVIGYFDRPPAGRSAIKLYIIAFGPAGCAESAADPAGQSLAAFADATGGTCLQASGADPGRLLAQVLDQISTGE